jgi:hypothetical protein
MQDAAKRSARLLVSNLPVDAFDFSPQITQIDADDITNYVGRYLRYLRHLRAKFGVWAGVNPTLR